MTVIQPIMYTSEDLQKSVNAVNRGEMSIREASQAFKVPRSTIDRRRNSVFVEKLARGPSTTLTSDEETGLKLLEG